MTKPLRGADIVARSLARLGCRHVFTLSGNHIMSIFDAALVWAVTPLTTVRARAQTTLDESTIPNASGAVTSRATLEVQHDLRRNLRLTGAITAGQTNYRGISLREDAVGASLGEEGLMGDGDACGGSSSAVQDASTARASAAPAARRTAPRGRTPSPYAVAAPPPGGRRLFPRPGATEGTGRASMGQTNYSEEPP